MTEFKSAPGWDLANHVMTCESISDASRYDKGMLTGSVIAYRSADKEEPAFVKLGAEAAGFSMSARMTPERARRLAAALIQAADICERYEAGRAKSEAGGESIGHLGGGTLPPKATGEGA